MALSRSNLKQQSIVQDTIHSVTPDADIIFYPFRVEDTRGIFVPKPSDAQRMDVGDGISAGEHLIDLRTTKAKGSVGSWTCTLGSGINWKRVLHPGCWCLIYISNQLLEPSKESGLDSGLKMVGIVKSIRRVESVDPSSGTRIVRYTISGEDFQSILMSPIFLSVNLSDVLQGQKSAVANAILLLDQAFSKPLSPSQMAQTLIDSLLGSPALTYDKTTQKVNKLSYQSRAGEVFQVPASIIKILLGKDNVQRKDIAYTSLLTFFLQGDLVGKNQIQSDLGRIVTVWGLIKTYCHELLNETYTELLPVNLPPKGTTSAETRLVPSFVIRAIPFSSPDGKKKIGHSSLISMQDATDRQIPKRKGRTAVQGKNRGGHFFISKSVYEDEIMLFNSGKSDSERFNFFYVPPNYSNVGQQGQNEAAFFEFIFGSNARNFDSIGDRASIARYGLRPFLAQSDYLIWDNKKVGIVNSIVRDMWERAYLFETGSVVINGTKEHIPVGTNIEFAERGWIGHVERVEHNFAVAPNGKKHYATALTLTRIQMKDGTPVDPTDLSLRTEEPGQLDEWDRGYSKIDTPESS